LTGLPGAVAVVGAGFTGLAVAYELVQRDIPVTVLEAEADIGGLASSFDVGGQKLERFYHHWFTSDRAVMQLIDELRLGDRVTVNPTNTGVYYANQVFRLSTPWDVLRFAPLSVLDRIRLGLVALRARRVRRWQDLEERTAAEWLREMGGERVYEVVWKPLLNGKFGAAADDVSAVWFWNKLKLRGGSRGRGGEERLAYFNGGFAALAQQLADRIRDRGGRIEMSSPVSRIHPDGHFWSVTTAPFAYLQQLRRIRYLATVCLVLELDRALSDTYWLNVNDPSFPFVGVIEHTNLRRPDHYDGRHVVYLSKYLPHTDEMYAMDANELLAFALPHLKRIFPAFERSWVQRHHAWKARWAQPVVERRYGALIPPSEGPLPGFHVCSMAQVYPEDRGTNYAIREGRLAARRVAEALAARHAG
jgi:protoporphyrinogen oxidase